MNDAPESVYENIEPAWKSYLRGMAFVLPAVMTWAFTCVYLAPKIQEVCAAGKLEPAELGWLWRTPWFLVHSGRSLLFAFAVLLVLLELVGRKRTRYRKAVISVAVWLLNVVVLLGMITLLILVLSGAGNLYRP